ncbi:MAG: helix-turn-helix transcriptional regulator [Salana multivorans]|uniref:TetR/AcrR family transcriptional regulator n=1 Tax=Salana multivorans TaxID=120377 RepID=UPI000966E762|nr:TetR/AcrR family transcriptional regulator [Salana multivorans]MBN8882325.1 helix-turn-helix transcriptional regulator [Salana multivorans]OJX97313.1 MAG: hypothetical protein BGO96_05075 [Micrococcales bacterium 73-15]
MPRDAAPRSGPKVPASGEPTSRGRPSDGPTANRGPAAAAANRAAILAAAQRLFASEGFLVPLSAIAREAGVGQGVLYRHFRGRTDLADAVFEDNLVALEETAASAGPGVFAALWRELLEHTVTASAFVELVLQTRHAAVAHDRSRDGSHAVPHAVPHDGARRLADLVGVALARSRAAGELDADLTTDDVLLAWRMAFGIVTTAPTPEQARADLAAARLLGMAP